MSFFSRVAQSAGLASRPAEAAAPAPAGSSAAAAGLGTPLHLIQYNADSRQFELGQEALAVLRGVTGPVGVVSVCGRARQVGSDHSCLCVCHALVGLCLFYCHQLLLQELYATQCSELQRYLSVDGALLPVLELACSVWNTCRARATS